VNASLREVLAPSRRTCGSLAVSVRGEACWLRCSGALWLPERHVLVAGDLHLEKGSSFARGGQFLPPFDSRATLDRLEAELDALRPRTVVLLGDSFHDSRALLRMAAEDRRRLERLSFGRDWVWVEGNHDRDTLRPDASTTRLPGDVVETLAVGALTLTHEPRPAPAPGEVAGHLHPAAKVVAYARGVRRPCFVTDGERLLLPAFGAFTGGLSVRDPAIADLFPAPPLLGALGRDRVHPIAWRTAA
jgi:uncharacterized protein